MTSQHPNATAAGITGAAATLIVYAGSLAGVTVPDYVAAAIVTVAAAAVLAVGRRKPRRKTKP